MANKVNYGLRNVYYSVITESGNTITYGTPKALAGAVNVALAPSGDTTNFYADDIIYFSSVGNMGYEGTFELAKVSDDFKKDVLGFTADSNGALIEDADATFNKFAFGFEVQGNEKPQRTWYYYCSVARPEDSASTKEQAVNVATATLNLTATPRPTDNAVKVSMEKTTANESAFNSFFSAVYEKVTSV